MNRDAGLPKLHETLDDLLAAAPPGRLVVSRDEMDCAEWLHPSAIVSHTPAPKPALKVGDRVRDGDGPVRTVAWIEDGHAFLSPLKGTTYMAPWTLSEVETWERLS